jgi:uncharacterized protein YyaL (SSP411 family)
LHAPALRVTIELFWGEQAGHREALAAMRPIQGMPALYLCENFTCRAPVTSPEDARRLLDRIPEKSLD